MLQWRWKLRRAQQAVDDGRYDEACRLLADPTLRDFLPAKRLADELAKKLAERAGQRIGGGRSAAGFADLAVADNLAGRDSRGAAIRDEYAGRAANEAVSRLIGGGDTAAAEVVARAARHGVDNGTLRLLAKAAQLAHAAERSAVGGETARAEASLRTAASLIEAAEDALSGGDRRRLAAALTRRAEAMAIRHQEHTAALNQMTTAVAAEEWSDALTAVASVLRSAPNDPQAAAVRRRAWKRLGMEATRHYDPGRPAILKKPAQPAAAKPVARSTQGREAAQAAARRLRRSTHQRPGEEETVSGPHPAGDATPRRRMLWIDGVGGLLVCLDDEAVIGQPSADPARSPAVAVLADLSRRHAVIRREAGRYVLQPFGRVQIDGKEVRETTVLSDECLIELGGDPSGGDSGGGVRFRFEKPHALSATARLMPVSGHRLSPPADAVLLMADSCVMGPAAHCHVRCRDWQEDVVLYRQANDLLCRAKQPLLVDGVEQTGPVELSRNTRLEGQDFAFSVEDPDAER